VRWPNDGGVAAVDERSARKGSGSFFEKKNQKTFVTIRLG
jgi:hypothetical protein